VTVIDDGGTGEAICLAVFVAYVCIAFLTYPLWSVYDPGSDEEI